MKWCCLLLLSAIIASHLQHTMGMLVQIEPKIPEYEELDRMIMPKISTDPRFAKFLRKHAGYYIDPRRDPSLRNTVFMTAFNTGYMQLYHNFKCYADRLGIKFLTVVFDSEAENFLKERRISRPYLMPVLHPNLDVKNTASYYGSPNFNAIGCRKIEAVLGALELGYNVVFSDLDIVMLHDPIKKLFVPHVDYTYSQNLGCNKGLGDSQTEEGNTGFYAVKPTNNTIATWERVYKACSRVSSTYEDQQVFWQVLRHSTTPKRVALSECPVKNADGTLASSEQDAKLLRSATRNDLVVCPLNDCEFSSGNLRDMSMFDALEKHIRDSDGRLKAYTLHANWMIGIEGKISMIRACGLWAANSTNADYAPLVAQKLKEEETQKREQEEQMRQMEEMIRVQEQMQLRAQQEQPQHAQKSPEWFDPAKGAHDPYNPHDARNSNNNNNKPALRGKGIGNGKDKANPFRRGPLKNINPFDLMNQHRRLNEEPVVAGEDSHEAIDALKEGPKEGKKINPMQALFGGPQGGAKAKTAESKTLGDEKISPMEALFDGGSAKAPEAKAAEAQNPASIKAEPKISPMKALFGGPQGGGDEVHQKKVTGDEEAGARSAHAAHVSEFRRSLQEHLMAPEEEKSVSWYTGKDGSEPVWKCQRIESWLAN